MNKKYENEINLERTHKEKMERVCNYWTKRAHDFNIVRKNELAEDFARPWMEVFEKYIPEGQSMKILDVGTGSGYFAVILSKLGHQVIGIDLTEAMLEEARKNCIELDIDAVFLQMDAQNLSFEDETFDLVVSRNLTWTLPDPKKAYTEWFRVLKTGGMLLNFDANYGINVRNQNQKASYIKETEAYGHIGVTPILEKENAEITLSMPISREKRPEWDISVLKQIGFSHTETDCYIGKKVLSGHDLEDAPMFMIVGIK